MTEKSLTYDECIMRLDYLTVEELGCLKQKIVEEMRLRGVNV